MNRLWLLVVTALCCASCATQILWESTDYRERIFIPEDQITRAELERRGVAYTYVPAGAEVNVKERVHHLQMGGYLVEKSFTQKLRDHAYRALATPVTLTADTAVTVGAAATIVGVIWIANDPQSFASFINCLVK